MADLFASGAIVGMILVLVAIEALLLSAYRLLTGRGLALAAILANLLAGACLLMALRAALRGERWAHVAVWLVFGLAAHLLDLWTRWRSASRDCSAEDAKG